MEVKSDFLGDFRQLKELARSYLSLKADYCLLISTLFDIRLAKAQRPIPMMQLKGCTGLTLSLAFSLSVAISTGKLSLAS